MYEMDWLPWAEVKGTHYAEENGIQTEDDYAAHRELYDQETRRLREEARQDAGRPTLFFHPEDSVRVDLLWNGDEVEAVDLVIMPKGEGAEHRVRMFGVLAARVVSISLAERLEPGHIARSYLKVSSQQGA